MAITFRSFLPKRIQNTRWALLVDQWQNIIDDIKTAYTYKLRDKYNKDVMDDTEFKDLMYRYGYDLPYFDGYTSSGTFFRKQALVISKQIKAKTTPTAYQYAYYVYGMIGYVLVQRYIGIDFIPQYDPSAGIDVSQTIIHFDQELPVIDFESGGVYYPNNPPIPTGLPQLTFDSVGDPDPNAQFLFFDGNAQLAYCNHFCLSYSWKFVESTAPVVFATIETTRSFYESSQQFKRKIEVIHYQPRIEVNLNLSGTVNTTTVMTEDQTSSATIETIYINPAIPLTDVVYVRFGIDGFSPPTAALTDVATFTVSNTISTDFYIRNSTATNLEIELLMEEYTKYDFDGNNSFSEVILWDAINNPVAYIRFPRIYFYEKMLNSVYFNLTAV
jgi:hypothetical protein